MIPAARLLASLPFVFATATPLAAQDDAPLPLDTLPDAVAEAGVADPEDAGTLPPFTSALSEKAARAIGRADWETARAAYAEMLADAPNNALTLANLGVVEFQMGDNASARTHLERAVRIRPGLARAWTTLGLLYIDSEEPLLAVSALTRAIHGDPTSAPAHNYLAVAAKSLGWNNAAELELQRAIDLKPKYSEAHFNLSLIFLERRPPATELARRHYYLALELGATPDPLVEEQISATAAPTE